MFHRDSRLIRIYVCGIPLGRVFGVCPMSTILAGQDGSCQKVIKFVRFAFHIADLRLFLPGV